MEIKTNINPRVLIWAREERGFSIDEVAKKLKLSSPALRQWETSGSDIPFGMLRRLAAEYKRQTAVFFLETVPEKIKKPDDCRNLAGSRETFSPETLLAIRRTDRYLEIARNLLGEENSTSQYSWIGTMADNFNKGNYNDVAEELRVLLQATVEEQKKIRGTEESFRYWRNKIEDNLGVFVFQFSMPEDELDGFSYITDGYPFAIVVNERKPAVRKVFTLFHEIGHIIKHQASVCRTDISTDPQIKIELECNKFAGEVLIPEKYLKDVKTLEDISRLARSFNVSSEVYLRRLFDKSMITDKAFFGLLKEIREKSKIPPKRKQKGFPSQIILSKSTRGKKLFDLVTNAAVSNRISYSVAADVLGLRIKNIGS
ncbi:MAG: ImmA/IrrE family metallo-endopeptidase [Candidatus Portnoybacteria bacterium]|nr:ImmA/IrrE family metallo-endopeptidase [Candidatus Portnoybacteria bacterium]MDD4983006.1 ImmA/IrrE family metallo-endopeptidase [Candidatus Portnoybacteria bacterium]